MTELKININIQFCGGLHSVKAVKLASQNQSLYRSDPVGAFLYSTFSSQELRLSMDF